MKISATADALERGKAAEIASSGSAIPMSGKETIGSRGSTPSPMDKMFGQMNDAAAEVGKRYNPPARGRQEARQTVGEMGASPAEAANPAPAPIASLSADSVKEAAAEPQRKMPKGVAAQQMSFDSMTPEGLLPGVSEQGVAQSGAVESDVTPKTDQLAPQNEVVVPDNLVATPPVAPSPQPISETAEPELRRDTQDEEREESNDAVTSNINKAIELVVSEKRVSISFLRDRLGIKTNEAKAIIARLEDMGIVSKPAKNNRRKVYDNKFNLQTGEVIEDDNEAEARGKVPQGQATLDEAEPATQAVPEVSAEELFGDNEEKANEAEPGPPEDVFEPPIDFTDDGDNGDSGGDDGGDDDGSDDGGDDSGSDESSDDDYVPGGFRLGDEVFDKDFPVIDTTGLTDSEALEKVRGYYYGIMQRELNKILNSLGLSYSDGQALDFEDYDKMSETEKALRKSAAAMVRLMYNPSRIFFDGDVVMHKIVNKGTKNEARYSYIENTTETRAALQAVQDIYHITQAEARLLVLCRGGIGIDTEMQIAHKKVGEVKIYKDQVIEFCRDITLAASGTNILDESTRNTKRAFNNPMSLVTGNVDSVVRSGDSGEFVMFAGTECYPVVPPLFLIQRMCEHKDSPMHGLDPTAVQTEMINEWYNVTHPLITQRAYEAKDDKKKRLKQLFAWENMCRTIFEHDGIKPNSIGLLSWRDMEDRLSVNRLSAHAKATGDADIIAANEALTEMIKKNAKAANETYTDEAGNRKRNPIGDGLYAASTLQQAARASYWQILLTTPLEELCNKTEQQIAIWLSNKVASKYDAESNFEYTKELEAVANQQETQNALDIAERLIRIGGGVELLDAYIASGKPLNNAGLREFLAEIGVTSDSMTIPEKLAQIIGIKPDNESAFMSNLRHVLDPNTHMSGTGLFSTWNTKQFLSMACAEGSLMRNGNGLGSVGSTKTTTLTLTTNDMLELASGRRKGEELVSALLQTAQGREAFFTLGTNSLARKSKTNYAVRKLMIKNRGVGFVVRQFLGRFLEYDFQRLIRQIPLSHTLGYLFYGATTGAIWGAKDLSAEAQRRWQQQMGTNYDNFSAGLLKCLRYDCLMATNKLAWSLIVFGVITAIGGVRPPKNDKDRYTMSEWIIGSGEQSLPLKLAWWLDDLSGVSVPVAMGWAVLHEGYDLNTAYNVMMSGICSWNRTSVVYDMLEFIGTFDQQYEQVMSGDGSSYNPSAYERLGAISETVFFDIVGDFCPVLLEQILPYTKDSMWLNSESIAHTASQVYDFSGDPGDTRHVESYIEYMRRRRSQTSLVEAFWWNLWTPGKPGRNFTGYQYSQQPYDTVADQYSMGIYNQFYLDLYDPTIPMYDQNKRERALRKRAEEVDDYILSHYDNPQQAALDGFCLNYEARVNCIWHCYAEMDAIYDRYNQILRQHYYDDDVYHEILDRRDAELEKYEDLLYNYYKGDDIPWSVPRYYVLESDREYRYLDAEGNPINQNTYVLQNFGHLLGMNEAPVAESYRYGGRQSGLIPFVQPNTRHDTGYNFETLPLWLRLDENGNPINDVESIYDTAGEMGAIPMGRHEGQDIQELMWGGQGDNMKDNVSEELRIPRSGVPTTGDRNLLPVEDTLPDVMRQLDGQSAAALLGVGYDEDGSQSGDGSSGSGSDDSSSLDYDDYDGAWGGEFVQFAGKMPNSTASNFPDLSAFGINATTKGFADQSFEIFVPKPPANSGGKYGNGGKGYRYRTGRYYRSTGYGGSANYNPRIYSNPRQVYSDRAEGLQTNSPYKATTTYLRPNFATKGSREAYRRNDF